MRCRLTLLNLGNAALDPTLLNEVGGKAKNLHKMLLDGLPVPPCLCLVSSTYDYQELERQIIHLGGFPVAIRSSGSLEDGSSASFAGLYETFLGVSSMQEAVEKIEQCFASLNSERVKEYLQHKNMDTSGQSLKMSVVVQKMVDAKVAGVLFTQNPLNGKEEEMLVEYCEGLGERLVSGHITPTQQIYNWFKNSIELERVNTERTHLSNDVLSELIDYGLKIQSYYGSPQDIEWAIDKNKKIFMLQTRPITTFKPRTDLPELTNADFKDGGVSARVCTPLMYSIYERAFQESMKDYFVAIKLVKNTEAIQWIYYQYGRAYWNAGAVKSALLRIPGFDERSFDRDLGIQKDYGASGPRKSPLSIKTIGNAIPVLMGLFKEFSTSENIVKVFQQTFAGSDQELKNALKNLPAMNQKEFSDWFMKVSVFQHHTEKNYFRTIYNNSNYQSEVKKFLREKLGLLDHNILHLMSGLAEVSHVAIQKDLEVLKVAAKNHGIQSEAYLVERGKFLLDHYHHGPTELDLTVPRWGEMPHLIDDIVSDQIKQSTKATFKGKDFFEQEISELLKTKLGKKTDILKKKKFFRMISRSREFLHNRELMRSYSTRAYYLLRLAILEFSRRFGFDEKSVFMLTIHEMQEIVLGENTSKNQALENSIRIRRFYFEGYKNFVAPNEFGGSIQQKRKVVIKGEKVFQGIGCSPGVYTGRARVVKTVEEARTLQSGEILVTCFTDPGWTPFFSQIGAVVTEVGGVLSHAAVIGREYGIPAVLNLESATNIIKDGAQIRVDGSTGEVEILG